MDASPTVDLRECATAHLTGTLLSVLRDLSAGQSLLIASREDPEWALRSIDLHLQHRFEWCCAPDREGWTTTVRCVGDRRCGDLIGLLLRDHRRMDALFARALVALNADDADNGAKLLATAAAALKRHLALEDDLLAPRLIRYAPGSADAAQTMHVEHAEILTHLRAVEESLAAADCGEAAIIGGMLCALVAKHEHREESTLLPLWQAALARLESSARDALAGEAFAGLGLSDAG